MNKLRNDNPVLVYGKYELLQPEHPTIYAYTRKMGQDKMLILLNFSKENATIDLPEITPTLPPTLIITMPAISKAIPPIFCLVREWCLGWSEGGGETIVVNSCKQGFLIKMKFVVFAPFVMAEGHLCVIRDLIFDAEVAFSHDKSNK